MKKKKVVVVGNGMVGHHFVESLMATESAREVFSVTVVGDERTLAYDRVHLSEYFAGKAAEDLLLSTEQTYAGWGAALYLNQRVVKIDRKRKTIRTQCGAEYNYDKLILATGSYPFVPPIPGSDLEHCLVYRTLDDLENIKSSAEKAQVGVVIGGGLLGLEAANALKQLGLKTHVVEFAPQLMSVQLDQIGGRILKSKIESLGVDVHTAMATDCITSGQECRYKLCFKNGASLETDLVVFSAGIRPYDDLARSAEIDVGERGGIVIDNYARTSETDIYAIGECALWNNQIFGLVAPGYQMAKVASQHLMDEQSKDQFTGADMSTKLKLMGVDVGSIGDAHGKTSGCLSYVYENQSEAVYKKLVISSDKQRLLGAVLVGDTSQYDTLLQYVLNGIELPKSPEVLLLPASLNDGEVSLGADALPDSAVICSCHNVSKGDIVQALDSGACDLSSIKQCTKASTGCGGCGAMLKSVLDAELAQRGVAISNDICEHFQYTRQELYELIKEEKIRKFSDLISRHGKGLGCDVCKPLAGSIFASLWNEFVLKKEHAPLQDTNDRFLANIQVNGTYSVVPRVPGGEITPDKLIALGLVAKKYDLYTKVTGGQRIDLFGARLEHLPEIWGELIDAGFETGHAYGKSLRTVKSCVGSTWCRYGVKDSVSMAIFLENRYKGLRAPHKIKMAVSGCTRECAEAQSKDIGVIATDKGWNLYVCGNGGMRPRHADLFATDLDDNKLVTYIDRILMFYVKTADRLQRTSVWFENLDGGLAYLRQVVVDDKLGICQELEAQMHYVISTYQCEWKTAISDKETLKSFTHFVNSAQKDSGIEFVKIRNQIQPATEVSQTVRHGNVVGLPQ